MPVSVDAAPTRTARALHGPWRVLTIASLAQFGISVVDQGIPTLAAFVKSVWGALTRFRRLFLRVGRGHVPSSEDDALNASYTT